MSGRGNKREDDKGGRMKKCCERDTKIKRQKCGCLWWDKEGAVRPDKNRQMSIKVA